MKGIKTRRQQRQLGADAPRSDHCPAMKGIKTLQIFEEPFLVPPGSDHCPAMKGIKTSKNRIQLLSGDVMKRPLPRNEGD